MIKIFGLLASLLRLFAILVTEHLDNAYPSADNKINDWKDLE